MPRQYEKVFWQLVQTAARIYIKVIVFCRGPTVTGFVKYSGNDVQSLLLALAVIICIRRPLCFDTVSIHGVCVHFMEMR